jgi:hypothetical protein
VEEKALEVVVEDTKQDFGLDNEWLVHHHCLQVIISQFCQ